MEKKKTIFSVFLIILFLLSITIFVEGENTIIDTVDKQIDEEKYNYIKDNGPDNKEIGTKTENTDSDIIGKIEISGTNINHQMVQGTDNEFYLNHSIYKKKNTHGSVFVDYRNTLNDRKLLIYGHNSQSLEDALFHDLEKYLKKSFYESNKYIDLVINNEKSKWLIFSVMIVEEGNNNHMKITFNDNEWIKHIDWMKDESIYNTNIEVGQLDKIITLQTCYYKPKNSYLIVNAKKI